MNISDYLNRRAELVDQWLDLLLPPADQDPQLIHQAMRYSVFAGGKRLRPVLSIATGELFDSPAESILPVACSLEMVHTYSLVHDDLPAMDDDDLRRGLPTCHVKFGEAIAILAGDALLTQAFIAVSSLKCLDHEAQVRIVHELATASGTTRALIGGQVLDLQFEGKPVTAKQLEEIHRAKTGALIRCAVRVGAIIGGASEIEMAALTLYGEKIGLAFQIADDLLDETATTEQLGKTAGKDAATNKATYTSLYGVEEAQRLAATVTAEAIEALRSLGSRRSNLQGLEVLEALALFIIGRRS